MHEKLIKEIKKLKKEKNAVLLVHNYQAADIYEVGDFLGDSLELSRKAADTDKDIIVFCGVRFMAETAKILSPDKTVLLPAYDAGCPMADMIKAQDIEELKRKHPNAAVACYVNTTAEVKAASDICVTSSNAVEVVNSLEEEEVIFIPDKNLSSWVAKNSYKKIIPFEGFCYVHHRFTSHDVEIARKRLPNADLIVHPECNPEVVEKADFVCSTSGMIDAAKNSKVKELIIGTEAGMIERLVREVPDKNYYSLGSAKMCYNMKKTTLSSVLESLKKEQYKIELSKDIADKARVGLERMLAVT